jgi:hypothetical protein
MSRLRTRIARAKAERAESAKAPQFAPPGRARR